jgi:glycine cleavage system H protein
MTNSQFSKQIAKTSLLYLGLAVALIVALPLLAGLAYAVRFVVPVVLVGLVIAAVASPTVRRWFSLAPDAATDYKGLPFPAASVKVHSAHAWAEVDGKAARVGADALALAAIGSVGSVETPVVGMRVEQGATLFSLRRGARRLDVKAPVAGIVAAVNSALVDRPEAIAQDGWIVRLQDIGATDTLLGGGAARRWFRAEIDRFTTLLSPTALPTMADGGKLAADIAGQIDDEKWRAVAGQLFANRNS